MFIPLFPERNVGENAQDVGTRVGVIEKVKCEKSDYYKMREPSPEFVFFTAGVNYLGNQKRNENYIIVVKSHSNRVDGSKKLYS